MQTRSSPAPVRHVVLLALGAFVLLQYACSSQVGPTPGGPYESANPSHPEYRAGSGGAVSGGGSGGSGGTPSGGSEGRAIEEADIVRFEGDRLYALSRYGGLSVIDVSVSDRLRLLGRHKIAATPFEMYVRDGIVFVLYLDYGDYTLDEETDQWIWHPSSSVVALDARNPALIERIDEFTIPGIIADSRIVGDILYAAAYENGSCWGCAETPRTNLISLDLADPLAVTKVDELSFEERSDTYSWHRSLAATDERLYIAGPDWGVSEPVGSTIQVIDISDPSGAMREGAAVQIAGQVQSRWQMDEYDGVLRVVSQPFQWNLEQPPSIETFAIESSESLTPLGTTALILPEREQLQSVRFDGPRGYAITFERTDPLFTLDLSNPAEPKQAGYLTMPGWVYHMEPRGDRLLGLGFDQGNPEGSLAVSLFDVSDIALPRLLSRVNFGGDWSSLDEDQDRIHKAFNVLDADNLILVPFAGWEQSSSSEYCYGSYLSGVQLIDWYDDALVRRGVAPVVGQARRGLLHEQRLFTMSDERIETYDVADRDAPARTAVLPLAQFVSRTLSAGDEKLVRIGHDWWTNITELDVTTVSGAANPGANGRLEIPQLNSDCYGGSWLSAAFAHGDRVHLVYDKYEYDPTAGTYTESSRVVTADVSNPPAPAVVADSALGFASGYGYGYSYGLVDSGSRVVGIGSTLAFADRASEYRGDGTVAVTRSLLRVVDLQQPEAPRVTNVGLPAGLGATGLVTSGSIVATSHYEASPNDPNLVRFYLDRVDVSAPSRPRSLASVNVPGSLLSYDAPSARAVTVDYGRRVVEGLTAEQCYTRFSYPSFEGPDGYDWQTTPGTCTGLVQTLHLLDLSPGPAVLLGSRELGERESVSASAKGDNRLFVSVSSGGYYGGVASCFDCYWWGGYGETALIVLGGTSSGGFESGRLELETGDYWSYTPIAASGARAVLSNGFRGELSIVDATAVTAPTVARSAEVFGYVQDLRVVDDVAIAAMGYDGVATLPLGD